MGGGIIGLVLSLIEVVFIHQATAQSVRVVGDSTGWTVPTGGAAFYSEWASKFNFSIGDYLTFNFRTNMHSVLKVPKESMRYTQYHLLCHHYRSYKCITSFVALIGTVWKVKSYLSTSQLPSPTILQGMQCLLLQTAQPPTRPPPSHGEACARTPANSSSSSPPICDGSSSALTPSSSTLLMANLYVTLYAIVMNLF